MAESRTAVLLGGGPVAVWTAFFLQQAGIPTVFRLRSSQRGRHLADQLTAQGLPLQVAPSLSALQSWNARLRSAVSWVGEPLPEFLGYQTTLWVAVPHTEAVQAVEECLQGNLNDSVSQVVVLSSGLGLSAELQFLLKNRCGRTVPVATYSNFFGASKILHGQFALKALKRTIHLGADEESLKACQPLNEQLSGLSVRVSSHRHPLAAEIRNICLYAHGAFGLASYTLERVFGLVQQPRFLYKLFPEGPLTRERSRLYAQLFLELSEVWDRLGLESFNLLEFLDHENYPVPSEYLSPQEIATFREQTPERQGDLLYFRYTGLLVDPFGQPDQQGRYPDFSAVPVEGYSLDEQGRLRLPRIPGEDLLNLYSALSLGQSLGLEVPVLQGLEREVLSVVHRTPDKLRQLLLEELFKLKAAGQQRAKCVLKTLPRTLEEAV